MTDTAHLVAVNVNVVQVLLIRVEVAVRLLRALNLEDQAQKLEEASSLLREEIEKERSRGTMKRLLTFVSVIGLLVLLLAVSVPTVVAQSGVDLATNTPGGGGESVALEPVGTVEVPVPDAVAEDGGLQPEQGVNLITLIAGFAVGIITGTGGALMVVLSIVHNLRNDRVLLAAIEGLTNSYPPETKGTWLKIGEGLKDASEVIKEVFDGVPVGSKPLVKPPGEADPTGYLTQPV